MAKQYKTLHPAKYYRDYLNYGVRPDGRELDSFRPIIINAETISTADGSAIVKIGQTTVVCGIKAEFCTPKAETPEQGFLIPNVELTPLCSSKFRPGPPSDQAQVLTKFIADVLVNAECVSLEDLCIFKDKLAWCLFADLICLDYDGALADACVLALIVALKTLKLPEVEYDPLLDNKVVNDCNRIPVTVNSTPVCTTYAIFDDKTLITDPTQEEENLCNAVVSVVTKDNNTLCGVHKPGGSRISDEDLFTCIERSKCRSVLVNELIETALENVFNK